MLYRHYPDFVHGLIVQPDRALCAKRQDVAFKDRGLACDIHAVRHLPDTVFSHIPEAFDRVFLVGPVLILYADPQRNDGPVSGMLAYYIYFLCIMIYPHNRIIEQMFD